MSLEALDQVMPALLDARQADEDRAKETGKPETV